MFEDNEERQIAELAAIHLHGYKWWNLDGYNAIFPPDLDPEGTWGGNGRASWKLGKVDGGTCDYNALPRLTLDIGPAWGVVEEMLDRGFMYDLASQGPESILAGHHSCSFYGKGQGWGANAKTAPLAICRAALHALGVEVPGKDAAD